MYNKSIKIYKFLLHFYFNNFQYNLPRLTNKTSISSKTILLRLVFLVIETTRVKYKCLWDVRLFVRRRYHCPGGRSGRRRARPGAGTWARPPPARSSRRRKWGCSRLNNSVKMSGYKCCQTQSESESQISNIKILVRSDDLDTDL